MFFKMWIWNDEFFIISSLLVHSFTLVQFLINPHFAWLLSKRGAILLPLLNLFSISLLHYFSVFSQLCDETENCIKQVFVMVLIKMQKGTLKFPLDVFWDLKKSFRYPHVSEFILQRSDTKSFVATGSNFVSTGPLVGSFRGHGNLRPIHLGAMFGLNIDDIIEKMVVDKEYPNFPSSNGWTPLLLAAKFGQLEIIKTLARFVENPNEPSEDGQTPISFAAANGHLGSNHLLLSPSRHLNRVA